MKYYWLNDFPTVFDIIILSLCRLQIAITQRYANVMLLYILDKQGSVVYSKHIQNILHRYVRGVYLIFYFFTHKNQISASRFFKTFYMCPHLFIINKLGLSCAKLSTA